MIKSIHQGQSLVEILLCFGGIGGDAEMELAQSLEDRCVRRIHFVGIKGWRAENRRACFVSTLFSNGIIDDV